jgi:hypothetical protein
MICSVLVDHIVRRIQRLGKKETGCSGQDEYIDEVNDKSGVTLDSRATIPKLV